MADPLALYTHLRSAATLTGAEEVYLSTAAGTVSKKTTTSAIAALGGGGGPSWSQNQIYIRNNPSNPLSDFNFGASCDTADSPLLVAVVIQNSNAAAPTGWAVYQTAGQIRVYTRTPDGTSGDYLNIATSGGGSNLVAAMWEFHGVTTGAYGWNANTSPTSGVIPTVTLTTPSFIIAVSDGPSGTCYGPVGWGPGVQGGPYGGRGAVIMISPTATPVRAGAIGLGALQASSGGFNTTAIFAVG
jgi:hypothetical protein